MNPQAADEGTFLLIREPIGCRYCVRLGVGWTHSNSHFAVKLPELRLAMELIES